MKDVRSSNKNGYFRGKILKIRGISEFLFIFNEIFFIFWWNIGIFH